MELKPWWESAAQDLITEITDTVKRMVRSVEADEDLITYYFDGVERIEVRNLIFHKSLTVMIAGMDAKGNLTVVGCPANLLKLTFKRIKREPSAAPKPKIGFITE